MKKKILLVICLTLLVFGSSQMNILASDFSSLVETEKAFAKLSETNGIKESFLTYFADSAIVFRPRPVNGKKLYTERKPSKTLLTWRPTFADISLAGDLGYTTGPFEIRKEKLEDQPIAYGHFVSVWKKQDKGNWLVVIDVGIGYYHPDTTESGKDNIKEPIIDRKVIPVVNAQDETKALLDIDSKLSDASLKNGYAKTLLDNMSNDVKFFKNESFPFWGKDNVKKALSDKDGELTWKPIAGDVSCSGDLGYTYGISQFKSKENDRQIEEASYLRIWKKQSDGLWKIVLEIVNPIPSEN